MQPAFLLHDTHLHRPSRFSSESVGVSAAAAIETIHPLSQMMSALQRPLHCNDPFCKYRKRNYPRAKSLHPHPCHVLCVAVAADPNAAVSFPAALHYYRYAISTWSAEYRMHLNLQCPVDRSVLLPSCWYHLLDYYQIKCAWCIKEIWFSTYNLWPPPSDNSSADSCWRRYQSNQTCSAQIASCPLISFCRACSSIQEFQVLVVKFRVYCKYLLCRERHDEQWLMIDQLTAIAI